MKRTTTPGDAAYVGAEERLIVKEKENLHDLARFFQAMMLNFLKSPGKLRAIRRLNLTIAFIPPSHPDSAVTLTFARGQVILANRLARNPDLKLLAEVIILMKIARVPAGTAMLRFLGTPGGKDIIARVRKGELKIQGIFRHPLSAMRFVKFMAPNTR